MKKFTAGNGKELVFSIDDKHVIKEGHTAAFYRQRDFLLKCKHPNFVKIQSHSYNSYTMDYYPSSFLNWINGNTISSVMRKTEELLAILENLTDKTETVRFNQYEDKLLKRTGYRINFKQLSYKGRYGLMHGDCTIANILIDQDDQFVFIDPRGTDGPTYYDYSKLLQSTELYYEELLGMKVNKLRYNLIAQIIRDRYSDFLLDLHLAIHLLGAIPFLIYNGRGSISQLFLRKGLSILDQYEIEYERTTKS